MEHQIDIPEPPRFPWLLISLFIVAFAVLISLGTWQLQRLDWKQDLISRVEARPNQPLVPAPAPDKVTPEVLAELEYRQVSVAGVFNHAGERHLYFPLTEPRGPLSGPGVMVFTPIETVDGWRVLVNRGFAPDANIDPTTRADGQLEGQIQITGLLRQFEPRNALTPTSSEALVFARDKKDLTGHLSTQGGAIADYYIDATANMTPPGGLPQAGETRIRFANNHLQYVITWYGLAAALAGVAIAWWRSQSNAKTGSKSKAGAEK